MNELRIIIAGSRDFDNYKVLEDESSKIIEKELNDDIQSIRIISGTARGADQLGERFAKKYNYSISCFPDEWGYMENPLDIDVMLKWLNLQYLITMLEF